MVIGVIHSLSFKIKMDSTQTLSTDTVGNPILLGVLGEQQEEDLDVSWSLDEIYYCQTSSSRDPFTDSLPS